MRRLILEFTIPTAAIAFVVAVLVGWL